MTNAVTKTQDSVKSYESKVKETGFVTLPDFQGERVYMLEFFQKSGLPDHLSRWQDTVDQMLDGITTDLPIYLMIDQKFVRKGEFHRRPGVHIDGYWVPAMGSHGGHGGRHKPMAFEGRHGHKPFPVAPNVYSGGHGGHGGRHKPFPGSLEDSWENSDFSFPEALILASNVASAKGYEGIFSGPIKNGGACEHLDVSGLRDVPMEAGKAYVGNVTFLHETLPAAQDCLRTLVRLNVPGYSF